MTKAKTLSAFFLFEVKEVEGGPEKWYQVHLPRAFVASFMSGDCHSMSLQSAKMEAIFQHCREKGIKPLAVRAL